MRSKLLIFLMIIWMLIPSIQVFADQNDKAQRGIEIDGSFDDWVDKPFVVDSKHDIKSPWKDFQEIGYFADDEYLYLKVERLSAHKSEPWHFNVVILNAVKGKEVEQYPFGESQPVYAPQYDIAVDGEIVEVNLEGELLESTLSSAKNFKIIEFRVPLKAVGLDELNKEVKFMLKSEEDDGTVDWVADGRPIIITTGPTLAELTSIVFFSGVAFLAYKTVKKKNEAAC